MDVAPMITAASAFVTGVAGAIALLVREIRRVPKQTQKSWRLVGLMRRTRDWLESEELWDKTPPSLRRDIDSALAAADAELAAEDEK